MKKTILVTGGAGYIGTNVVNCLLKKGYYVVVVDNFSNSFHSHIEDLKQLYPKTLKICDVDICDKVKLNDVFVNDKINGVIHLAGKKYIPESFEKEEEYFLNNITGTQVLLDLMTAHNVKKVVFSSSITVYGNKQDYSIKETKPYAPISPYAQQKVDGEKMVLNWAKQNNSSAVVLRLSNPIGADANLMLGEDSTSGRKGLLPYLIDCARDGQKLVFNGNDHPTRDGTTIRDYVHVMDVAKAFVAAFEADLNKSFDVFNIGTSGEGYTVLEVLKQVENIVGFNMDYSFGPKRAGDASVIITNNEKAKEILKYKVTKSLQDMVESQYVFQTNIKKHNQEVSI